MSDQPKLIRVKRLDSVPLEKVEYTPEGFLIDTPIVTSVGIFEYHDADGGVHRELRLPEQVFAEESLATYEGKPVIITHDAGRVSKENVADEIVGTILSKGYRDGDDVRCKIIIHSIDEVKKSGLRELSLGYDLVLDETPGEWNGQTYDAIQTEIAINHLAIVREARAGEQARLNIDSREYKKELQKGEKVMSRNEAIKGEKRKRRLDEAEDITEPMTEDEESEVVEEIKDNAAEPDLGNTADKPSVEERVAQVKDRRDRRDTEGAETSKEIIAQQDEDIEQLLEIIEELQAVSDIAAADKKDSGGEDDESKNSDEDESPINADSVDAIIAERLKLGRIGDKLNLDGLESLRPLEAKKRIIRAVKPELKLDGKGKHYINTAFDIAVQELSSRKDTAYQRRQMFNADNSGYTLQGKSKSQQAREKMLSRMQNGGKE